MESEQNEASKDDFPTIEDTVPTIDEMTKAKEAVKRLVHCGIKVLAIGL